MVRGF